MVKDTATGAQAGLTAGTAVCGCCLYGDSRALEGLPVAQVLHRMGAQARSRGPSKPPLKNRRLAMASLLLDVLPSALKRGPWH